MGVPAKESPSSERSYYEPKAQPPVKAGSQRLMWECAPPSVASEEAVRGGRWDGVRVGVKLPLDSCGVNNSCGNGSVKHSNTREAAVVISETTWGWGRSKYSMIFTVR